jgi:hypothetical protein
MDQKIQERVELDELERHKLEDRIQTLRAEGKTFREIGRILGLSQNKARYLCSCAVRRSTKRMAWTAGLSERLANSLHWLGFKGRDDVKAALISGHLQTLGQLERSLRGPTAIGELRRWLE